MEELARVVLGFGAQDVAEQVMHFLDRTEKVRVVGAATDDHQLAEAIRQLEPDVVLASPELLESATAQQGTGTVLAVDTAESVEGLRTAVRVGARGFYVWPGQRQELADMAARVPSVEQIAAGKKATTIAVYGSRGGAGATFVATHLASAFARMERDCVLVDMDPAFGEVAAVLGVPQDPSLRTIEDLAPVTHEMTDGHLDEVLWSHPHGFRVLLAPPQAVGVIGAGHYVAALDALARRTDVIVIQLPRALDEIARAGVDAADRVVVVLTMDVLSFHGAKRALVALGDDDRFSFVVNRAVRSEIVPADVGRVFGRQPVAVIPADRAVAAAQDRGRLLSGRGKSGRAISRLARTLEKAQS